MTFGMSYPWKKDGNERLYIFQEGGYLVSEYGKIAQDEVVSRWEDDVDELQQEDWKM